MFIALEVGGNNWIEANSWEEAHELAQEMSNLEGVPYMVIQSDRVMPIYPQEGGDLYEHNGVNRRDFF